MANFVELGSRKVDGLTDEQIQYFRDHSKEFEKAMDNAIKACEKDRESHKELMDKWDEIFTTT